MARITTDARQARWEQFPRLRCHGANYDIPLKCLLFVFAALRYAAWSGGGSGRGISLV